MDLVQKRRYLLDFINDAYGILVLPAVGQDLFANPAWVFRVVEEIPLWKKVDVEVLWPEQGLYKGAFTRLPGPEEEPTLRFCWDYDPLKHGSTNVRNSWSYVNGISPYRNARSLLFSPYERGNRPARLFDCTLRLPSTSAKYCT